MGLIVLGTIYSLVFFVENLVLNAILSSFHHYLLACIGCFFANTTLLLPSLLPQQIIMNGGQATSPDVQISLADMKLLVTAVITFDPTQIVSAFFHVERLKKSLLQKVNDTFDCLMAY